MIPSRFVLNPNVRAFLWMLRYGEGTQGAEGYRTLFGGQLFKGPDGVYSTFDDFLDHPRQLVTMKLKSGGTLSSTAAGAYQFLQKTWDALVKQYDFRNFEPLTQDLAAICLIAGRGALEDVVAGRIEEAVQKCNKEWASLPGSPYGQPVVSMDDCMREYLEAGGQFYPQEEPASPIPHPQAKFPTVPESHPISQIEEVIVQTKENAMPVPAALIPALLPPLIQLIPQLGKIFGSGSDTQVRNVEAATKVLEVAKEALGVPNEQAVVEAIQKDPAAAATVKAAVEKEWFSIIEVGGGITEARKHNLAMSTETDSKGRTTIVGLHKQPAFWITILLLVPVYFVVFMTLQPWWNNTFSDEVKLVVVTAIISGVLSAITGFWLGSSFGSHKKDDDRRQPA